MAEPKENTEKKAPKKEEALESLVRILTYDIKGSRTVYAGLKKIKGVSWAISNAICIKLKIPRTKKISELTKDEIGKIESFIKSPDVYPHLMNARFDLETGESKHLYGTDLDLKKEFDIKRLKKIKSYKGVRHSLGLPVNGQRTRSNFRRKGQAVGVKRKGK